MPSATLNWVVLKLRPWLCDDRGILTYQTKQCQYKFVCLWFERQGTNRVDSVIPTTFMTCLEAVKVGALSLWHRLGTLRATLEHRVTLMTIEPTSVVRRWSSSTSSY
jgi:hypothetical protein